MNGDDEDSFDAEMESEALLEEQRATPPLSSKPEGAAPAKDEDGTGKERQQASEPDPELPEALKGKYVPHGRFHETNERLKETNQRYGLLEQRTNKLLEIIQQQLPQKQEQAPKDEIPPPEDYAGRIEYALKGLQTLQEDRTRSVESTRRAEESNELADRVTHAAIADFEAARVEDPGMVEAYNYLAQSRIKELVRVQGLTQAQASAAYRQEQVELYHAVLQRNGRPSEVVMGLAADRGWTPKAPTNDNTEQDREQRKLQHRSLSQMGGREGPSALNAKDLAKMSEDEYAKLSDDVIKAIMRKAS